MSLKVHVLGWRGGVGQQVDRIEQGFRELGCELVSQAADCDLLYVNDSTGYDPASIALFGGQIRAKGIFNVLDLAPHLGAAFPLERVKAQLSNAHAVTTISTFVQRDLAARAGVKATVIYNPIRAVTRTRTKVHPFRAMFVGRVGDPVKRASLGASALAILGFGYDEVVTVGREAPHYGGVYWGCATDETLTELYNSVDFVMFPSVAEGLGLPMVEAMCCGAIPVMCNDLGTREEFLPRTVFPEYEEVEPTAPSIARFVGRFMQDNDAKAEFKERLWHHYMANWEHRLSPKGVAQAIVGVYESL